MHEGEGADPVLLHGLDAGALEGGPGAAVRVAHHLHHLAAAALELAEDGAQLLGLVPFDGALAGLEVPQQGDLGGGVVVDEAEQPLPDLRLLGRRQGVWPAPAGGAQAEEEVRQHQRLLPREPDRPPAVEYHILVELDLHRRLLPSIGTRRGPESRDGGLGLAFLFGVYGGAAVVVPLLATLPHDPA